MEQIATHMVDADALAELRDMIDELRKATGAAAPAQTRTIRTHDHSQLGAAIQGDVHGNLTIGPITLNAPAPANAGSGGGGETFASYCTGLRVLLERLGTAHPRYDDALTYEQRLRENIAFAEHEGDTDTRRADRAAIIKGLNTLAMETLGVSFNALCV